MFDLVIKAIDSNDCRQSINADPNFRSSGSTAGGGARGSGELSRRHRRAVSKDIFGISPMACLEIGNRDFDFLLLSKFKERKQRSTRQTELEGRKTEEAYFNQMVEILGSPVLEDPMRREQVNYEDLESIRIRYGEAGSLRYSVGPNEKSVARIVESVTWNLLDLITNFATPLDIESYINSKPKKLIDFRMLFDQGRTLLTYAVIRGISRIVSILLASDRGLISLADESGLTPLHYAVKMNHLELIGLLIEKGADPNSVDSQGRSPLHWAAGNNNLDCYLMLKAKNCSGLIVDKYGLKPLECFTDGKMQLKVSKLELTQVEERSGMVQNYIQVLACLEPRSRDSGSRGSLAHFDLNSRQFLNKKLTLLNRLGVTNKKRCEPQVSDSKCYKDNYRDHLEKCYRQEAAKLVAKRINSIEINNCKEVNENEDTDSEDSDTSSGIEIPSQHVVTQKDFIFLEKIGKGSFGEILCASIRGMDQRFALKSIAKSAIARGNLLRLLTAEKKVMANFDHPFMVGLHHSFQTKTALFLVMDYCEKQDLAHYIRQRGTLTEHQVRILACELVLAIKAMHANNFIHRDIKIENVMIDSDGHVKLGDFGLAKELASSKDQTKSFCGSIAYLPPEILKRHSYGKSVDWYLLGELIYELLFGKPPYYEENKKETQDAILFKNLKLPSFTSSNLKDLIYKLLQRDPNLRLGAKFGAREVMEHPFFIGVDWQRVFKKEYNLFDPTLISSYPLRQAYQGMKEASPSNQKSVMLPFWNYSRQSVI